MKRLLVAVLAGLAVLSTAGCNSYNDARGRGDAPVASVDDRPAEVVNFPDRFGNVASKCDAHGHRLFVVTHEKTDPNVVVVDDRSCPGGAG